MRRTINRKKPQRQCAAATGRRSRAVSSVLGFDVFSRDGAVLVELALTMPIFFLVILGICEVGQILRVESQLSQAARLGCATGSQPASSNSDVIRDVRSAITVMGRQGESVAVTILVNGQPSDVRRATTNDQVTVSVTVPTKQVTWTGSTYFIGPASIQSESVTMLRLR